MPIIPFRTLGQLIGNTLYFNTDPDRNDRYWNTEGEVPIGTRFISDGENLSPEVANRPLVALGTDVSDLDWVTQREYAVQAESPFTTTGTEGNTVPIYFANDRIFVQRGDGATDPRDTFYIANTDTGQLAKNDDGTEIYVTSVESTAGFDLLISDSISWEAATQALSLVNFIADGNKPPEIVSANNVTEFGRDYLSVAPAAPFGAVEAGDLVVITDTAPKLGHESNDGLFTVREKLDDSTLQLIPFFRAHNPIVLSSSTNGPLPLASADPSIELSELSPGVFGHCYVYYNTMFLHGIRILTNVDIKAGDYILKHGVSAQFPMAPDSMLKQGFLERTTAFNTQSYSGTMQDVIERLVWNPEESNQQWNDWHVLDMQSLWTVNLNLRDIGLQGAYDHNSYGAGNIYQKGSGRQFIADAGPTEITVTPSWGYGVMSGLEVLDGGSGVVGLGLTAGTTAGDHATPLLMYNPSVSSYSMETAIGSNYIKVDTIEALTFLRQDSTTGDGVSGPQPHIVRIPYETTSENADAGLYYVDYVDDGVAPKQVYVKSLDGSTPTFAGYSWSGQFHRVSVSNMWYVRASTYAGEVVNIANTPLGVDIGIHVIADVANSAGRPIGITGSEYSVWGTQELAYMLRTNSMGHMHLGGVTESYYSSDYTIDTVLTIGNSNQAVGDDPLSYLRLTMAEINTTGNISGLVGEYPYRFAYGGDNTPPFDGAAFRTQWHSPAAPVEFHLELEARLNYVKEVTGTAKFLTLFNETPWSLPTDPEGSDFYIELFSQYTGVRGIFKIISIGSDVKLTLGDALTGAEASFGGTDLACRGRIFTRDCVIRAVTDYASADMDYIHIKVPSTLGASSRPARGLQMSVYDPYLYGGGIRIEGKDLRNTGTSSQGSLVYIEADYNGGGLGTGVKLTAGSNTWLTSLMEIDTYNGNVMGLHVIGDNSQYGVRVDKTGTGSGLYVGQTNPADNANPLVEFRGPTTPTVTGAFDVLKVAHGTTEILKAVVETGDPQEDEEYIEAPAVHTPATRHNISTELTAGYPTTQQTRLKLTNIGITAELSGPTLGSGLSVNIGDLTTGWSSPTYRTDMSLVSVEVAGSRWKSTPSSYTDLDYKAPFAEKEIGLFPFHGGFHTYLSRCGVRGSIELAKSADILVDVNPGTFLYDGNDVSGSGIEQPVWRYLPNSGYGGYYALTSLFKQIVTTNGAVPSGDWGLTVPYLVPAASIMSSVHMYGFPGGFTDADWSLYRSGIRSNTVGAGDFTTISSKITGGYCDLDFTTTTMTIGSGATAILVPCWTSTLTVSGIINDVGYTNRYVVTTSESLVGKPILPHYNDAQEDVSLASGFFGGDMLFIESAAGEARGFFPIIDVDTGFNTIDILADDTLSPVLTTKVQVGDKCKIPAIVGPGQMVGVVVYPLTGNMNIEPQAGYADVLVVNMQAGRYFPYSDS